MIKIIKKLWFYNINFEVINTGSKCIQFRLSKDVKGTTYVQNMTLDIHRFNMYLENDEGCFKTQIETFIDDFLKKVEEQSAEKQKIVMLD